MSRYDIPDPLCHHRRLTGFVSWPSILDPGFAEAAHASTQVCPREACIDDAQQWVRAHTGHHGIHVTFAERDAQRAGGAS